uniref:Uncharacterized protein n=1 Tax=Moniliophthora roreri TaxID=221103 RepID=A0A0W0F627_MONRR
MDDKVQQARVTLLNKDDDNAVLTEFCRAVMFYSCLIHIHLMVADTIIVGMKHDEEGRWDELVNSQVIFVKNDKEYVNAFKKLLKQCPEIEAFLDYIAFSNDKECFEKFIDFASEPQQQPTPTSSSDPAQPEQDPGEQAWIELEEWRKAGSFWPRGIELFMIDVDVVMKFGFEDESLRSGEKRSAMFRKWSLDKIKIA